MQDLLKSNIYDVHNTIIIVGSCLKSMQEEGYKKLLDISDNIYNLCLEESHINMAITKIAGMISTKKIKRIIFASVDKSPHCVQMHYIKHELERIMDLSDIEIINYVVVNNELIKISPETITISKSLSKIESMSKVLN
jgi:succinate dehydrogenase flavin-adding protein (antitoxin of CptAB toxin-antitoxin module)